MAQCHDHSDVCDWKRSGRNLFSEGTVFFQVPATAAAGDSGSRRHTLPKNLLAGLVEISALRLCLYGVRGGHIGPTRLNPELRIAGARAKVFQLACADLSRGSKLRFGRYYYASGRGDHPSYQTISWAEGNLSFMCLRKHRSSSSIASGWFSSTRMTMKATPGITLPRVRPQVSSYSELAVWGRFLAVRTFANRRRGGRLPRAGLPRQII